MFSLLQKKENWTENRPQFVYLSETQENLAENTPILNISESSKTWLEETPKSVLVSLNI